MKPDKQTTDMTDGGICRHLLRFALPLMVGNLFQQLYNTVDTWVVGNFVSNEAFSAVGTVAPIINVLIGTYLGFSSGVGVLISQRFGARDRTGVQRAVHTSMAVTLILGVLLSLLGLWLTPALLRLIQMPPDVYPQAQTYLRIYFAGLAGLLVYNMGSGILRAVGNSRHPLYFLICCTFLNIVLDLLFVLGFHMGVAGVAYATILAQGISAALVLATLLRSRECIRLCPTQFRIHLPTLKCAASLGIPTALEMAVISFSNVFVQAYINYFGSDCMGGWTAYSKIDQLIFLPVQSIGLAVMTFVGQNLGKGKMDRVRRGVHTAAVMALTCNLLTTAIVLAFAPQLVRFFIEKESVVDYGVLFLRSITPFYLITCITQVYPPALRGAGRTRVPMIITISSFVVFRQAYLYIMANHICNEVIPIVMSYPAGWIVCAAATLLYYYVVFLPANRRKG